jgi:PAS domain S-box-containing protein
VVARIARICALGLGLNELLDEVCREVLGLSGAEECLLAYCPRGDAAERIWRAAVSAERPDGREAFRRNPRLPSVLELLRVRGPLEVPSVDLLPADDPIRSLCVPDAIRSAVLHPLKIGTRLVGFLALHSFREAAACRDEAAPAIAEVVVPVLSAALERRRMEDRMRESETRYRFLADNALDFISLHDASGKCLYASPAVKRMLGYRPEELFGSQASVFIHPDDRPRFEEENRSLAAGEVPAAAAVYRMRRKDGSYSDVETMSSSVPDERKGSIQVLRVARDVSERKKIESRLFETQKLETIGMLAGGVAHEYNNLLVGILGAMEMLEMLLSGNWEAQKYLGMIARSGERAVELTRQLLAYSRQGMRNPRIMSLNRAVQEDIPILKSTLQEPVELLLDLSEDLPPVSADITQIKQVVMSLCLNASEAMPDGGTLVIRTRKQDGPLSDPKGVEKEDGIARRPLSGVPTPGPRSVLEVSDTGCGMDAMTISRIFEPFFSTKFVGRGMGLAAVCGIVESHGGEILVRSEPGKGTTFTVAFPAASGVPLRVEAPEAATDRGGGTVLVVDDEDDVREVAKAMLESFGYRVLEARDGVEAVELYRDRHDGIDLVLLDLMMPRMTGDLALSEMRRIRPGVRALLASGYDESGRVREIVDEGFDGFLQKPFRRRELGRKVDEILRRAERQTRSVDGMT